MNEENAKLRAILEGAILAAGEPLSINKLLTLFEEQDMPEKDAVEAVLKEIQESCEDRGFTLKEVATGWRFQVKEDYAPWVNRLWEEKPQKYSRALLETLSLIAYRQPITRGDIEEVRGVAVSSHIIKTLMERDWVKVVGHRDVPGRPALYATTRAFLDYFNLKSLEELPTLGELKDIDSLEGDLGFSEPEKTEPEKTEPEKTESEKTESEKTEANPEEQSEENHEASVEEPENEAEVLDAAEEDVATDELETTPNDENLGENAVDSEEELEPEETEYLPGAPEANDETEGSDMQDEKQDNE